MRLEEITQLGGYKLLDTSSIQKARDREILRHLFSIKDLSYVDTEKISSFTQGVQKAREILRDPSVFSISEVGEELSVLMKGICYALDFCSEETKRSYANASSLRHVGYLKRRQRIHNEKVKARKRNEIKNRLSCEESYLVQEAQEILNISRKEIYGLIKQINQNNAVSFFSDGDLETYNQLVNYFIDVGARFNLKHDYSGCGHSLKNKSPFIGKEKSTDEKLIAASILLSSLKPVYLFGTDRDFGRLLGYYLKANEDKQAHHFPEPKNKIIVYSDFEGQGFKPQMIYPAYHRLTTSALVS